MVLAHLSASSGSSHNGTPPIKFRGTKIRGFRGFAHRGGACLYTQVPQKEWPGRWPHDFMSDGELRPDRCPIGEPVLVRAAGIVWYPFFQGYLLLAGEGIREYKSLVAQKKSSKSALYNGFRIGQFIATEQDVQTATHIYELGDFENVNKGGAIDFVYEPTDRVGRFENGCMILAPMSAFVGFVPHDGKSMIEWRGKKLNLLTRLKWIRI